MYTKNKNGHGICDCAGAAAGFFLPGGGTNAWLEPT
jgi:hypothetical protein